MSSVLLEISLMTAMIRITVYVTALAPLSVIILSKSVRRAMGLKLEGILIAEPLYLNHLILIASLTVQYFFSNNHLYSLK